MRRRGRHQQGERVVATGEQGKRVVFGGVLVGDLVDDGGSEGFLFYKLHITGRRDHKPHDRKVS